MSMGNLLEALSQRHGSMTKQRAEAARLDATRKSERDEWVSTNGVTAIIFMFFDRGTFWLLPFAYFYLPKSARAYLFPQSVKIQYFRSRPSSVDPHLSATKQATIIIYIYI